MSTKDFIAIIKKGLKVTGNTYAVKKQIKALGCVWGKQDQCWFAPNEETQRKAQAIVKGTPAKTTTHRTSYSAPKRQPQQAKQVNPTPPQVNAAEVAEKHGRTLRGEGKPLEFSRHGGEVSVGEVIEHSKLGTLLVVSIGERYYLSQEWLEDMDEFNKNPGYYREYLAVPVGRTSDEQATIDAKEAKTNAIKETMALLKRPEGAQEQPAPEAPELTLQAMEFSQSSAACWFKGRLTVKGNTVHYSHGGGDGDYDMTPVSSHGIEDAALADRVRAAAAKLQELFGSTKIETLTADSRPKRLKISINA